MFAFDHAGLMPCNSQEIPLWKSERYVHPVGMPEVRLKICMRELSGKASTHYEKQVHWLKERSETICAFS
jgi:hypothetical protein